jgi:hypothetical protein
VARSPEPARRRATGRSLPWKRRWNNCIVTEPPRFCVLWTRVDCCGNTDRGRQAAWTCAFVIVIGIGLHTTSAKDSPLERLSPPGSSPSADRSCSLRPPHYDPRGRRWLHRQLQRSCPAVAGAGGRGRRRRAGPPSSARASAPLPISPACTTAAFGVAAGAVAQVLWSVARPVAAQRSERARCRRIRSRRGVHVPHRTGRRMGAMRLVRAAVVAVQLAVAALTITLALAFPRLATRSRP